MIQATLPWIRQRCPSSELMIEQEMAQKTRQEVLRRHQRERLTRARWRQLAPEPVRRAQDILLGSFQGQD